MEAVGEKNGEINIQDEVYNSVSTGYTQFAEGDLLFAKITPCMENGKIAIARDLRKGVGYGSTEFHVLRPRSDQVTVEYLWGVLTLDSFLKVAPAAFTGSAGQQRLPDYFLEELPVPIPSPEIQSEWVEELQTARESRRRKIESAEALLASIDNYVLKTLDLKIKQETTSLTFGTKFEEIQQRCDVPYHSPRFHKLRQRISNGKYKVRTIEEICAEKISAGFAAGRDKQVAGPEKGVPHIRPLNITPYGELTFEDSKYVPRDMVSSSQRLTYGEVLLNNTNSTEWVGKSTVFDVERECCCSNHITRLHLKEKLANPWFIAALLNSIRATGYFGILATNFVNQAGINTTTLRTVEIPLPDIEVQKAIAAEVNHRKDKAQRLRAESKKEWDQAKARFEGRIMGEPTLSQKEDYYEQ